MLKKQFGERDIQRIRNLVKGKSGDRTIGGVGYSKSTPNTHEEGEVWEEGGKTWTIKGGIRENITKLDKFKKTTVPLFCPKCKVVMSNQLDPYYYKSYGECVNCRAKFETTLKLEGKWEDYLNDTYNKEIDLLITEYKNFYNSKLNESTQGYITEAGEVEKWVGGVNKQRAEESLEDVIKYLEGLKK
tara:strand:+ start:276 stop:836 length:561 start_codon:yes stop_codon:yes gene_type:complete